MQSQPSILLKERQKEMPVTHWFKCLDEEPFFGGNVVLERSLRWAGDKGEITMAINNPSLSLVVPRRTRKWLGDPNVP